MPTARLADLAMREQQIRDLADAGVDRRAIAQRLDTTYTFVNTVLRAYHWERLAASWRSAPPASDPARAEVLEAELAALRAELHAAQMQREQVVAENRVLRRALTWERCKRRATPAPALPATARHDWQRDIADRWYVCASCGMRAYEPHTVQLDCAAYRDRRSRTRRSSSRESEAS